MEKKTNKTEDLLETIVYRLNDLLQNQLAIESQSETIKEFEEKLDNIKEAINKQTEALNTLKSYIIPFLVILCFLVSFLLYYVRKGL